MFLLWLLEFLLSFSIIYVLFCSSVGSADVWSGFQLEAANRAAALSLTIGLTAVALGLYCPAVCLETRRLLVNSMVAGVLAFPAILVVGWLLSIDLDGLVGGDPYWPLKILLAWVFSVCATRLVFSFALRLNMFVKRVVIVGSRDRAAGLGDAIGSLRNSFFEVTGSILPVGGVAPGLDAAALRSRKIWGVVVTSGAREELAPDQLLQCKCAGIRIFDEVDFCERQFRRLDLGTIAPDWLVYANGALSSPFEAAVRRFGDILISLAFLVFTLPLMLLTAVLIRIDSAGPIFYRQERVGLHGRAFVLFKFRSMTVDAEVGSGPSWAAKMDPRITRVGSIIRRLRIDELPQLVNVLRGEMSFIGPRPERPHFVEALTKLIPNYRDRAFVKPGLTGWAQVNYPYGASVEDARMKLSYDLYYVRHRSLVLDVLILFSTVRVILFQEGAR